MDINFNLHRPCPKCPFRTDCLQGWLGAEHAAAIAQALIDGNTFSCHETTNRRKPQESQCAGALLMLLNEQNGFSGAQAIACTFGWLKPEQLDRSAPVFKSASDFVAHHTYTTNEPAKATEDAKAIEPELDKE